MIYRADIFDKNTHEIDWIEDNQPEVYTFEVAEILAEPTLARGQRLKYKHDVKKRA